MGQKCILIVDDSTVTRNLVKILLAKAGYIVRAAEDSDQALQVLSEFSVDLILMDLVMPGMGGLDLTRKLKADPATRNTIIVAFTAYSLASDVQGALAAGCDAFITKPIDARNFVSQLKTYMGRLLPAGSRDAVP